MFNVSNSEVKQESWDAETRFVLFSRPVANRLRKCLCRHAVNTSLVTIAPGNSVTLPPSLEVVRSTPASDLQGWRKCRKSSGTISALRVTVCKGTSPVNSSYLPLYYLTSCFYLEKQYSGRFEGWGRVRVSEPSPAGRPASSSQGWVHSVFRNPYPITAATDPEK